MRTLRTFLASFVAVALLLGCSTNSAFKDIKVETEANPKVNMEGYSTYQWAAAAASVREGERRWTPADLDIGSEITFLVDRELREQGMTKVTDSPDVFAIYGVGVDMTAIEAVDTNTEGAQTFENVPKGGVLVLLIDAKTGQPMWAGSAKANISEEPSVDATKDRLDYGITQMFKKFPN